MPQSSQPIKPSADARAAILWGGLLAATFDLVFAIVFYSLRGATPIRIPQSIASGWLGKASFEGGIGSAALGVVSHYFILLIAATLYWIASRRLTFLVQRAVLWGVIYGVVIYLVMHYVVVPLSAAPAFKTTPVSIFAELCSHTLLVGVVIALAARKYSA